MRAYKFLTAECLGVFSHFAWPLPGEEPGAWIGDAVEPCRMGIHACRRTDLPYWVAPTLFEIELDGSVDEHALKVVAPRGRLIRRIVTWNTTSQEAYGQMCLSRIRELVSAEPKGMSAWAPSSEIALTESARLGYIAARIAEELGGADARLKERRRQSEWLVEQLALA
jgi:hypothetical protein